MFWLAKQKVKKYFITCQKNSKRIGFKEYANYIVIRPELETEANTAYNGHVQTLQTNR